MSVTERLLRVFRVDQQLSGLQTRLRAAERFLDEQSKQLDQIKSKRDAITSQLKQLQAQAAGHEGEMSRLDVRIEALREQMNNAKTNKEYKAFLTEVNTFKVDRGAAETSALELMTKADELKKQIEALDAQMVDRSKLRQVAADDRQKRDEEIRDRLNQLKGEREKLVAEVPAAAMVLYIDLVRVHGDDGAMCPVEELDRKNHEYTCGGCRMTVPMETVNALMKGAASQGVVTRCVSCGCILYIEKETAERLNPANKGGKKQKSLEV
ncbi:MAG: zinc ribbon domain-containing protein [Phycisphaerales bacterium]